MVFTRRPSSFSLLSKWNSLQKRNNERKNLQLFACADYSVCLTTDSFVIADFPVCQKFSHKRRTICVVFFCSLKKRKKERKKLLRDCRLLLLSSLLRHRQTRLSLSLSLFHLSQSSSSCCCRWVRVCEHFESREPTD